MEDTEIKPKTEYKNRFITSKISVDFFVQQVKIYIIIPKYITDKLKEKENNQEENQVKLTKNINLFQNKHLIINKYFKISGDTVSVDDKFYTIPEFFNREAVKNKDLKTWEMIFYQIFNDEVCQSIQKFKELYEETKNHEKEDEELNV